MHVKGYVRWAICFGFCAGIVSAGAGAEVSEAPKLRYGFQADREYTYLLHIQATIVGEKTDRNGDLILKVTSADDDKIVLKASGSAAQLGSLGMVFPHFGPPFARRANEGTTLNRRGGVVVSSEMEFLPMISTVIEEFPEEAKTSWDKEQDVDSRNMRPTAHHSARHSGHGSDHASDRDSDRGSPAERRRRPCMPPRKPRNTRSPTLRTTWSPSARNTA